MHHNVPTTAFLLAAGLGTRMRPLTEDTPKPLLKVKGRSLIDRALDRLVEAGVHRAVINVYYLPEQIERHLEVRSDIEIIFSRESERLETGGGIMNAHALVRGAPFYVITTDVIWQDQGEPILKKLAHAWKPEMVALLALQNTNNAYGYDGQGDFNMDSSGKLTWREEGKTAPYVFTGLQIMCPKIFERPEVHAYGKMFPLSKIYRDYLPQIRGIENTGRWLHIGTPEALENAPL